MDKLLELVEDLLRKGINFQTKYEYSKHVVVLGVTRAAGLYTISYICGEQKREDKFIIIHN